MTEGFQYNHDISVIIPTLNEKSNLKTLIPLLLKSTSGIREVIISDSTYSSDQIDSVFTDPRVKIIKCKAKRRSIQLNTGARHAQGSILFFIHADMRPPENFAEDITNAIEGGAHAGCFSYQFDRKSLMLKFQASFSKRKGFFSGGGDQGLFIKKPLFTYIGGYDKNLKIMEDFDLYDRLKTKKINFKIIQNPGVVSARKYKFNNYFQVNFVQFIVFMLFKLGFPQSWQLWVYRKGLKGIAYSV